MACFGCIISPPAGNHPHSMASAPTQRTPRRSGGRPIASASFGVLKPIYIKAAGRTINVVRVGALVHSRGRLAESCLLKSNRSPRSLGLLAGRSWGILPCWIYQPQSVPVECRMVLRLCLLINPASSDVSDAEDGALCRCNRRVCLTADPMHFFHSFKASASAGTTTNAIVDHIGPDDEEPCDIVVQRETLVHLPPSLTNSPPPGEEAMAVEPTRRRGQR